MQLDKLDVLQIMQEAHTEDLLTISSFNDLIIQKLERWNRKVTSRQKEKALALAKEVWDENYVLIEKELAGYLDDGTPDYDELSFCKYDWQRNCRYWKLETKQAYANYLVKRSVEENDTRYTEHLHKVFKTEILEQSITQ